MNKFFNFAQFDIILVKNMNNKFKKIISSVLIVSMIMTIVPIRSAQAAWIPGVDPMIKQGLEEMANAIKGIINATLKTALISAVGRQVEKAIGGSSTPIVIWSAYLLDKPLNDALEYGYNLVGQYTRGQQEGAGFAPDSLLAPGDTGPTARLAAASKREIDKIKNPINASNIGQIATVNEKGQLDVTSDGSLVGYFGVIKGNNNISLAGDIAEQTKKKEQENKEEAIVKQIGAGYDAQNPQLVAAAKKEASFLKLRNLPDDYAGIVAVMGMNTIANNALRSVDKNVTEKIKNAKKRAIENANSAAGKVYKNTF